jgi:glycine dehydrogenase
MIEPTESESKAELDRFCNALLSIKNEIDLIAKGEFDAISNPLTNAPHTLLELSSDDWLHSYTREQAAYPLEYLKHGNKFWAEVGRVDSAHGDRNLICVCAPIEDYIED